MLQKSLALLVVLSLAGPAVAQTTAIPREVTRQADAIVATYRQIIVLTADDAALDDAQRERVSVLGRILFQQNQDRLTSLSYDLTADPERQLSFLDRLENRPDYHDADKLVFRELLEDLADSLPSGAGNATLRQRIAGDRAALEQIQALYQKELASVFDRFQTRGMPIRREAWQKYLDFIQQKYSREKLLNDYRNLLPADTTRGGDKEPKKNSADIYGTELPPKTLLLTFDDGPIPATPIRYWISSRPTTSRRSSSRSAATSGPSAPATPLSLRSRRRPAIASSRKVPRWEITAILIPCSPS